MDDSKKTNTETPPTTADAIPEVDAEIVNETEAPTQTAQSSAHEPATDAEEQKDSPQADAEKPSASSDTKPKARRPGLVLFASVSLVALGCVAFWRFMALAPTVSSSMDAAGPAEASAQPSANRKLDNFETASVKSTKAAGAPEAANDAALPQATAQSDNLALQNAAKVAAMTDSDNTAQSVDENQSGPAFEQQEAASSEDEPYTEKSDQSNSETTPALQTDKTADETVAQLEKQIEEERAKARLLEAELAQLQEALRRAEQRAQTAQARANALEEAAASAPLAANAAALNAINRAIAEGRAFSAELSALEGFSPGLPELATLQNYADTGAPSLKALERSFTVAARESLAVAAHAQADGPVERLAARAKSLVSIRPAAPQDGASPRAIISRAENALLNGDLERTVDELDALPAPAQSAMRQWVRIAEQRIAVDNALDSLSETITQTATR
ncbi:MAG: hypothetical protein AAGD92_00250 [Pseudomonadota bacterium]